MTQGVFVMPSEAKPKFYEPEPVAEVVRKILFDQPAYLYLLDDLHSFYSNEGDSEDSGESLAFEVSPSAFIEFVADYLIREKTIDAENLSGDASFSDDGEFMDDLALLPVENAFKFYGVEHQTFRDFLKSRTEDLPSGYDEEDVSNYLGELTLSGELGDLYGTIAGIVLSILDEDGKTLSAIEGMIADNITVEKSEDNNE